MSKIYKYIASFLIGAFSADLAAEFPGKWAWHIGFVTALLILTLISDNE